MQRTNANASRARSALAFVASLLGVACTSELDGPHRSVEYYRNHPAEWERRVWICTNEPASFEHTSACANALQALRQGDVGEARLRHLFTMSSPATLTKDR